MLESIGEALQAFVLSIGYFGIFLLMVAESTFVPVPSVLIMPFAGSLAAGVDPKFSLPLVILMNSLGAMVGSGAFYEFGARGGKPGPKAASTLAIGSPDMDFVAIAQGLGVQACRATTCEEFNRQFEEAVQAKGPRLIDAIVPTVFG